MSRRVAIMAVALALVAGACGGSRSGAERPPGDDAAPTLPPAPSGPAGVYEAATAGRLSPAVEGVPARSM